MAFKELKSFFDLEEKTIMFMLDTPNKIHHIKISFNSNTIRNTIFLPNDPEIHQSTKETGNIQMPFDIMLYKRDKSTI